MSSKQDRTFTRTAADLERKYNYGKTFAEVMGLIDETKTELEKLDADLHQEIIEQSTSVINTCEGIIMTALQRQQEEQGEIYATKEEVTDLELRADGLEISVTQVNQTINTKADKTEVQEITERFIFAEDGMTISNTASGMGIGVSEERVVFTGGADPTTTITPNEMETTNLRVGERLDLGAFSFIPRNNGNLSFRYTGGS